MGQDEEGIKKLSCLRFVQEKEHLKTGYVIAEGRGKEFAELNGTIDGARKITVSTPQDTEQLIENMIYININGDILNECDLSYTRQAKNKLGNIKTHKLSDIAQSQED